MQEIEDLKEIFSAMQELGATWHSEIISLREKNSQLEKENFQLKEENSRLKKNFGDLKNDLNNLSEKIEQLTKNVSNEIITELNVKDREYFQKFVKDYLKKIRECVDGKIPVETVQKNSPENDTNNFSDVEQNNDQPDY